MSTIKEVRAAEVKMKSVLDALQDGQSGRTELPG